MKLNIETVKKVAEVAELVGEGSNIQINSHFYKSYEDALRDAKLVSDTLGLMIKEGQSIGAGWITMYEKPYGSNIEITLYYSIESGVVNA